MDWNFGDILDAVEAVQPPAALALMHGDRRMDWSEFSRASNRLAAALIARGARPGDKLAFYLRNCSEYLIGLSACFKARLVHVNVNYRYRGDELHHVLDDSDARYVLFGHEFAPLVDALRARLPQVTRWIEVGPGAAPFAEPIGRLCAEGDGQPLGIARSGDDLLFVYTGGTTGSPKGVMWRSEDLWRALGAGGTLQATAGALPRSAVELAEAVRRFGPGPVQLPACPLMHGSGLFTALLNLAAGGCTVTLTQPQFDVEELFEAVSRHRVASLVIVGDVFARPMLAALDASPGRYDLSSLRIVISSGVMWSEEVKRGLLRHHAAMALVDMYGSSEAVGISAAVSSAARSPTTARFPLPENCAVFTEDHRRVAPGSGERGFIACRGALPLGYYKDPEKTRRTFPTIGGVRYAVPGDWCTLEADGSVTLLGRGSLCINTGGEKVFPEEVEEALKRLPDVEDALVIGLPDATFGEVVTALVSLRRGARFDEESLRAAARAQLAAFKLPKRILAVDASFRAPSGKADYERARRYARERLGLG